MTGQYNVRNYVKFGWLDREQTTFAHQLKAAGYATAIAGKWQLGRDKDSPQHFGFEQSASGNTPAAADRMRTVKISTAASSIRSWSSAVWRRISPTANTARRSCTDFICDFIDKNKKPFLVYYPMILTHCPFDPPDSTDWDPKQLGSTTYKGDRNDPQRHFHDMVAYADKAVGQIVSQLEKSGVRDNTLIIFTGDNGTDTPIVTPWNGKKVVGGKGTMSDTGTRVPLIVNWLPASKGRARGG